MLMSTAFTSFAKVFSFIAPTVDVPPLLFYTKDGIRLELNPFP